MTNHFFLKSCFLLFTVFIMASCNSDDDDQIITEQELPARAKTLIKTHFPGAEWSSVIMDPSNRGDQYEVKLDNGYHLDFDQEGHWIEIEGHGQPIPESLVPKAIATYVQTHYPDTFIEEIKRRSNGFKIELSNEIDLIFDGDGNFIRKD